MRIQVEVTNIASGLKTHGSEFDSQELADSWIASQLAKTPCPWGVAEHQVETTPATYSEAGEILTEAVYETVPANFSVVTTDITAAYEAEVLKQEKIASGKAARVLCEQVLDLVAGYNLERDLTIEQITTMQTTFANAEAALRAGRPTYAKAYIEAIAVDGVLVTQEMKDICLAILG